MSDMRTVTVSRSVSPARLPSRRSFSARPPGSSRLSVSPCSSRSMMAMCSMRNRRSELAVPALACWASLRKSFSTEAARLITTEHPDTMVVLLSTYQRDDLPAEAGTSGAAAYVHKEELSPRLLRKLWDEGHEAQPGVDPTTRR